jgi:hypothetical protein
VNLILSWLRSLTLLGKLGSESESWQLCSLVLHCTETTLFFCDLVPIYSTCPCHGQCKLSLLQFPRPVSFPSLVYNTCGCCSVRPHPFHLPAEGLFPQRESHGRTAIDKGREDRLQSAQDGATKIFQIRGA